MKKADKTENILTGDPGKDILTFLKSKEKPFNIGFKLLSENVRNSSLINRLSELSKTDEKLALKILIENLKVISSVWKK